MRLKRWLLLAPFLLVLFLLQSYFWVPTYEKQATGNPERLVTYIEGSSGDAKILNPILNADTASSGIAGHVFEGLLDMDENLNLRGRLARNWKVSEKVYLFVNPSNRFPDGTEVTGIGLAKRIRSALQQDSFLSLSENIIDIEVLNSRNLTKKVLVLEKVEDGKPKRGQVEISFDVPERVAFLLHHVDQDFFKRLLPVVGDRYLENFPYERFVHLPEGIKPEIKKQIFSQIEGLFPVAEHNPLIDFHLRKGVRFHDGHEFDAGDVKFTYESIMNPKNLSPRTSDFEPIKNIEVIDSHTVRVVYNRNEHLEERRTMMQDWSDYLTTLKGIAPSTSNSNSVNESMEQYRKSKRKTF